MEKKENARHGMIVEGKSRMAILVDTEIKEELQRLAENENRSLSNFTYLILKQYVENHKQ